MVEYAFVIDATGKQLSPTKEKKAWYLIRKRKAKLISRYPMVIQISRIVPEEDVCGDEVRCGIDDGALHTGIALVQKCQHRNKVLFAGTIEQRGDVKKLIDIRRNYRRDRRANKRYRQKRFLNRASSRRKGRIAPSILQKKQALLRVIKQLVKWIKIDSYWLEDVSIDVRVLADGHKPYRWEYQKSNRLDENIRKAVILRDGNKCMECSASGVRLEVHHIIPKRLHGTNCLGNLITLCKRCHQKTKGKEEGFVNKYLSLLSSSDKRCPVYASHVMIGKEWLRKNLTKLGNLYLTTGGDTANKRIDWGVEKTHSNDAICITNLKPDNVNVLNYTIKPMRRRTQGSTSLINGLKHKDVVSYKSRNGKQFTGYVVAIYPDRSLLSISDGKNRVNRVSAKSCRMLYRYTKIFWLPTLFLNNNN